MLPHPSSHLVTMIIYGWFRKKQVWDQIIKESYMLNNNCAGDVKPLILCSRLAWAAVPRCFCRCSSWFFQWGRGSLKVSFFHLTRSLRSLVWKNSTFNDPLPHLKNQLEHLQKQLGIATHAILDHSINGLTSTVQLCSTKTILPFCRRSCGVYA